MTAELTPPYFFVVGTVKMIVQAETARHAVLIASSGVTPAAGYDAIKTLSADPKEFSAEEIEV